MQAYSDRYEAALILAARAHHDQQRKVGNDPYIVHLVHVSVMLVRYGFSEDVAIAGLLHDIIEDQEVPLADIEAGFGPAVAEMVAALTEWKCEAGVKRPWEDRKRESLEHLRRASREAVAVKAADALHSVHSLIYWLHVEGPSIWPSFTRGPEETLWYYRSVATIVRERWMGHPLAEELAVAVERLEQVIAETAGAGTGNT